MDDRYGFWNKILHVNLSDRTTDATRSLEAMAASTTDLLRTGARDAEQAIDIAARGQEAAQDGALLDVE